MIVDALVIDRPDPHGRGFYQESKEFCHYYRYAKSLQGEKEDEEHKKREREEAQWRRQNNMTESGLYTR